LKRLQRNHFANDGEVVEKKRTGQKATVQRKCVCGMKIFQEQEWGSLRGNSWGARDTSDNSQRGGIPGFVAGYELKTDD